MARYTAERQAVYSIVNQTDRSRQEEGTRMGHLIIRVVIVASTLALAGPARAQQPIAPVDFRPFVDGRNWIVRQPLTYKIGISNYSVTVPLGFVTDFASIPPALQSIIQQNGPYLLPAVVHDYLYWKQTCTRAQSDQILLLAMIENNVRAIHRIAIYEAVKAAGSFAWDENARDRAKGLIRIIPPDHQSISVQTLWPEHRLQLLQQGVVNAPRQQGIIISCSIVCNLIYSLRQGERGVWKEEGGYPCNIALL